MEIICLRECFYNSLSFGVINRGTSVSKVLPLKNTVYTYTSGISITWKPAGNADSWAPP